MASVDADRLASMIMRAWRHLAVALLAGLCSGGCGGYYVITVPDQLAKAGEDAAIVIRLQRNDFDMIDMATKNAPVRFRIGEGDARFAYTDSDGYAGTIVPTPEDPGRHILEIYYKDSDGIEITGHAPVYVWGPEERIVAVDVESLPLDVLNPDRRAARQALDRISKRAAVIYLSRKDVSHFADLRQQILAAELPDGPVLPWRRQYYRMLRGRWGIPRIVFSSHLVSQLDQLKRTFPNLVWGITDSGIGADEFGESGLTTYMLGHSDGAVVGRTRHTSWTDLSGDLPRELADAPPRGPLRQGRYPVRRVPERSAPVVRRPVPPDETTERPVGPPPTGLPDEPLPTRPPTGPLPDRPPGQPVGRVDDDEPVDLRELPDRN